MSRCDSSTRRRKHADTHPLCSASAVAHDSSRMASNATARIQPVTDEVSTCGPSLTVYRSRTDSAAGEPVEPTLSTCCRIRSRVRRREFAQGASKNSQPGQIFTVDAAADRDTVRHAPCGRSFLCRKGIHDRHAPYQCCYQRAFELRGCGDSSLALAVVMSLPHFRRDLFADARRTSKLGRIQELLEDACVSGRSLAVFGHGRGHESIMHQWTFVCKHHQNQLTG